MADKVEEHINKGFRVAATILENEDGRLVHSKHDRRAATAAVEHVIDAADGEHEHAGEDEDAQQGHARAVAPAARDRGSVS